MFFQKKIFKKWHFRTHIGHLIAYYIQSRSLEFDVFLITELWMRKDHKILNDAANKADLYMTKFSKFNDWL